MAVHGQRLASLRAKAHEIWREQRFILAETKLRFDVISREVLQRIERSFDEGSRSAAGATHPTGDVHRAPQAGAAPPMRFWAPLMRAMGPTLWPLVVFSLGANLLLLAVPLYMLQVYDRVLTGGKLETLLWLTVLAGLALAVLAIVDHARDGLVTETGRWLNRRLGTRTVAASLAAAHRGTSASQQPMMDLKTLRAFVGGAGLKTFFDAPFAIIFLICIFLIHPIFGLIAVVAGIALLVIAMEHARLLATATRASAASEREVTHGLDSAFGGIEAIAAMGITPAILARWDSAQARADGHLSRNAIESSAFVAGSKFLRLMVQIAVLGLGAILVLNGSITAGAMIAASILMARALQPFEQALTAWRSYAAAREALSRLGPMIETAPEASPHAAIPAPQGRLLLDKLAYLLPGHDRPLLGPLALSFEPGSITAVIGPSGAGKTSLCRLAVGIWRPTHGKVRLDGAELDVWPQAQRAAMIGYLPQDVQIVGVTPREVIGRLDPDAPMEAVYEAARLAGLHEEILGWAKGYETSIGAAGRNLSAGQRQRLGLARALYGAPKLLVLDEPNANLDAEGERALKSALAAARDWGATVLVVTHQMSFLTAVDRVVALKSGRVDFDGTPADLLKRIAPVPVQATGTPAAGVAVPTAATGGAA